MRPPWTIGRVIGASLATLLLGLGVYGLIDSHRRNRAFKQWETARPMDGPVDFSKAGRFTYPFTQTCASSHGEMVILRVPPDVLEGGSVTHLLKGLSANLEIRDVAGAIVASDTFQVFEGWRPFDGIRAFSFSPFRRGTYQASVVVSEGAPALAGVPQRLEARYLLCGLEQIPVMISGVLGVVSVVVGGIIGGVVMLRMKRDRRVHLEDSSGSRS